MPSALLDQLRRILPLADKVADEIVCEETEILDLGPGHILWLLVGKEYYLVVVPRPSTRLPGKLKYSMVR